MGNKIKKEERRWLNFFFFLVSEKGTNFKKEGREGSRDAETSVTFVWLEKPQSTADLTLWNSRDTNTNSAVWLEHKQSGERWMTVWGSTFMAPSSPNQHSHILSQQVLALSLGPGVRSCPLVRLHINAGLSAGVMMEEEF